MAAPRAVARCATSRRAPLERECALFQEWSRAGRAASSAVHDAPCGIIAAAMTNDTTPRSRTTCTRSRRHCATRSTTHCRPGLRLRSTAGPRDGAHTSFADRPLAEFLAFMELVVAPSMPRCDVPRERRAAARLLGQLTGPTSSTSRSRRSSAAALTPARSARLVPLDGRTRARTSISVLARHPLPGHAAGRGRDRHHTNSSSTPTLVRRPPSSAAAQAVGDPRRVIAGTDCGLRGPAPAWRNVAGEVCGEAPARCARALTWRARRLPSEALGRSVLRADHRAAINSLGVGDLARHRGPRGCPRPSELLRGRWV